VVGIDTVSTAKSAKEAGYTIYAADYFGDVDLRSVCSGCRAIIEQKRGKSCGRMESRFRPETFLEMAESLLEKCEMDAVLLCSGLDDDFTILYELNDLVPILGNHPKTIESVRKKLGFFEELKRLGIAHPDTAIVKNIDEAKSAALEIGYPVVVKPLKGFGGVGIRPARNYKEFERAFFEVSLISKDVLVQKLIDGIHASVSFLAGENGVKVLTINEQLLGLSLLFQPEPFGYCGNTVPLHFSNSIIQECNYIAEKIALHFGLKGSNGIDLVISEEGSPYVVEVNPRFQGTLECVERVLGINLVESHINACLYGSLPIIKERTSTFCTRLILYAHKRVSAPALTAFPEARDIPFPETIIEKGEPLCSVVTEGKTQNASFQKAKTSAKSIYRVVHPA
jgi:predicted ATP-grasp superfamily ATP-dependent carboligase